MLIFKCGVIVLPSTYILSLCLQVAKQTNSLDIGLAFLYIASGVIAGKIMYDRYQQIHILGSLTPNPNVTSFANRVATCSASFLSVGFLVYLFLFLFKVWVSGVFVCYTTFIILFQGFATIIMVDDHCLTALSIFVCGFSTLYIWMQCIITTYLSTLYYERQLAGLRQVLANASFLFLIVIAIFGTVTSFLPRNASGLYICFVVTSLCSYIVAAIFCVFILTFEKEYQYFAQGPRSDRLLDEETLDEDYSEEGLFGAQEIISSAMVIKGSITCAKLS